MKRIAACLMALILLVSCMTALADDDLETFNFGDFSMTFDAGMYGNTYDKTDGQVWFMLYPDYDASATAHPNINVVWSETVQDLTAVDPAVYAENVQEDIVTQVSGESVTIENTSVLSAALTELNGKTALCAHCYYEVEGYAVYMLQYVVSDEAFGSYIFTASYNDPAQQDTMTTILDTVTWTAA
ncbi:MAG: hypothetical protein Q4B32_05890 [Clostridia bacterium]|nr:hypothetical protein [Clostridia bacterium]